MARSTDPEPSAGNDTARSDPGGFFVRCMGQRRRGETGAGRMLRSRDAYGANAECLGQAMRERVDQLMQP